MEKQDSIFCKCLYFSANAFTRVITKMAEEEFSFTGLAPSYAFLLMAVNKEPGIQPKTISELMQLTPSTVTRLVEKMEHKGFVNRKYIGKTTEVYPTSKSLNLDKKIRKSWSNLYTRYSEILGETDGRELTTLLYEGAKKLEK